MSKPLILVEAVILTIALFAVWFNAIAVAMGFTILAGLVVVAQKLQS